MDRVRAEAAALVASNPDVIVTMGGRIVLPRLSRAPARPGYLSVRTARSWRGIVAFTHPRTGGAHDSHHWTAGIAGRTRRRGCLLAARGAGAAASNAGGRFSQHRLG